jgi:hypothetical protein
LKLTFRSAAVRLWSDCDTQTRLTTPPRFSSSRTTIRVCRSTTPTRRIPEVATRRLIEKFAGQRHERTRPASDSDGTTAPDSGNGVTACDDGHTVSVDVDGRRVQLDREAARTLRDELAEAVTGRREFCDTVGVQRPDGSYVVARRRADSAGHRKVFDQFAALRQLYDDLPERFGADDVSTAGVTGGRRHLLVRHFVEHPAFDCELAARQPLTARKTSDGADGGSRDS